MPKIEYITKKFRGESLTKIYLAEEICNEYAAQGLTITLRQLYYQFVARGHIPNKQTEYNNLGSLINDARLAGYIDWSHLEDRTRNLRDLGHWDEPADVLDSAARSYRIDKWARQPIYCEVWIEKDALVGVIERSCQDNDVPFFSCRGYTSQSEVWRAGQRILDKCRNWDGDMSRDVVIIHLGDHDPSGIDMTRDIDDRLEMFVTKEDGGWDSGYNPPRITRIALNYDQVETYAPPPNPAKLTDSRVDGYIRKHGYQSWELDALPPDVLDRLVRDTIDDLRDDDIWAEDVAREAEGRAAILSVASEFRSNGR